MNALLTVGAFLVLVLVAGLVFWRVTRRPGDEPPKRRELKRANAEARAARLLVLDLEQIIKRYRPVMDTVESALVTDLEQRIDDYKTTELERNK